MRGCFLILVWVVSALALHAQSDLTYTISQEGKVVAFPRLKSYELKMPAFRYESYTPSSVKKIEAKLEEFKSDYYPIPDELPMNMQVLSAAYRPFFNVYAPMLQRVSPMAFDFREVSVVPIDDNFTFLTVGSQYTWPGAGGITTINPMLNWNQDRLTITGGVFAGRYFTAFNHTPALLGGANLQVHYELTPWMAVKAWGQYAYHRGFNEGESGMKERYNPHMLLNPYNPHTSVGGAFEFMVNENVGFGVGVNYEFNPWRRKMEAQRLIYPVIRSGKVKIGAW